LTPMSYLITSPYYDRSAMENPLGVERKPPLKVKANLEEETLSVSSAIHHRSYASYKTYKSFQPSDLNMIPPNEDIPSAFQPPIDIRSLVVMQR
jgi:hypothetical protein